MEIDKKDINNPSHKEHIDEIIKTLDQNKQRWATLDLAKKISYLEEIRTQTGKYAREWTQKACEAKSISMDSPLANEEWLSGPFAMLYAVDLNIQSLKNINHGKPTYEGVNKFRNRPDGQLLMEVFPHNLYYRLLFNGVHSDIWMMPGITKDNLLENTAEFYRQNNPEGKTAVVLGAGNIASIAPLDSLHKLFSEGQVVLLKMNPVNEYLGPIFKNIFKSLIENGFFNIMYGAADIGAYLTGHKQIDAIHLTGSEKTFNTIVFGSGKTGEENRKNDASVLDKVITAELGGVSPSIVVPGPWTKKDIQFQVENLLIQKTHNAGCNCIASQILITPREWEKTPLLMEEVKKQIKGYDKRVDYYPHTEERISEIQKYHPLNEEQNQKTPIQLIENLSYEDENEYCFNNEFFAQAWGQTNIPGDNPEEYLRNAVHFCNEKLHGSLGANIIIHPKTQKALGDTFEEILGELKYGSIGVNIWTGAGFLLAQTSWGAFPGNKRTNVGSGIGNVHNTFLFDKPQKSIVYASFYPFPRGIVHGKFSLLPKPPWFPSNKKGHIVSEKLTDFQIAPGIRKLPALFYAALRG